MITKRHICDNSDQNMTIEANRKCERNKRNEASRTNCQARANQEKINRKTKNQINRPNTKRYRPGSNIKRFKFQQLLTKFTYYEKAFRKV